MDYLKIKRKFGPNECRSTTEIDSIKADLNLMTIEDLGKESDLFFVLDFLNDGTLVEHLGFMIEEVSRALQSLYKHITPNQNPWILESSLPRLKSHLGHHYLLEPVLKKISLSDGKRIAEAALQTLIYLELFRNDK